MPVETVDGESFTRDYAASTREKEIVAPPERKAAEEFVAEIRIIRHGITQGYSTDAGLTPMGGWQAHQRGHSLSKSLKEGQKVRIVCADTNRARQTAEQIHRGMLDGLDQWQRKAEVSEPEAIPELRNFGVWTPDGLRDVTSAFRQYQATMEKLERMAVGDRPRWLVEIDRFYRTQLGGADPIHMWLTIPLMYFEPPAMCVRRFWRGFHRLIEESPGHRIVAATHSGPIRAFATWAHGYDPGEPYNTEEVVVKVRGRRAHRAGGLPQPGDRGERAAAGRVPGLGIVTTAELDLDVPLRSVSIAMGVLGCFERAAELGATARGRRAGHREEHRLPHAGRARGVRDAGAHRRPAATGWACGCSRSVSSPSTG